MLNGIALIAHTWAIKPKSDFFDHKIFRITVHLLIRLCNSVLGY